MRRLKTEIMTDGELKKDLRNEIMTKNKLVE
jgi:hypothetical protein